VILLDTHIWIWWVHDDASLSSAHRDVLSAHEETGFAVSVISCWEVAIVATARLFARPLITADEKILSYPHVEVLPSRA
jgi:PIN domain nuclease of toxin-antitoxin system